MEKLIINIPTKSDAQFLAEMVKRLGFKSETLEHKLNRFIRTAPKNVPITDDEIMEEIQLSRRKRQGDEKQ